MEGYALVQGSRQFGTFLKEGSNKIIKTDNDDTKAFIENLKLKYGKYKPYGKFEPFYEILLPFKEKDEKFIRETAREENALLHYSEKDIMKGMYSQLHIDLSKLPADAAIVRIYEKEGTAWYLLVDYKIEKRSPEKGTLTTIHITMSPVMPKQAPISGHELYLAIHKK